MSELYGAYICLNENNIWFRCSLESALTVCDKIIIIDGGSTDGTLELINDVGRYTNQLHKIKIIKSKYDLAYKGANGKQRNKYLQEIPEEAWCIRIDCDEILSDNAFKLRDYMNDDFAGYNVKMVHFVYNLGLEDATLPEHFVNGAFFKKTIGMKYPEVEHPVLEGAHGKVGQISEIILYHFGYVKGAENIIRKFRNHWEKSNIHTKEFLINWKNAHIFGGFPVKPFTKFNELPFPIRREFNV